MCCVRLSSVKVIDSSIYVRSTGHEGLNFYTTYSPSLDRPLQKVGFIVIVTFFMNLTVSLALDVFIDT